MLEMELPFPPSLNQYRFVSHGRLVTSQKGRNYKKAVAALYYENYCDHDTISGPVEVSIDAYMPDKRRRDLDNLFKAVLDALTEIRVYEDDSQITKLSITKQGKNKKYPKGILKVKIKKYNCLAI